MHGPVENPRTVPTMFETEASAERSEDTQVYLVHSRLSGAGARCGEFGLVDVLGWYRYASDVGGVHTYMSPSMDRFDFVA